VRINILNKVSLEGKGSMEKPEKSDFIWRIMLENAPKFKDVLTLWKIELHRNFLSQNPSVFYIFVMCYNRAALYPVLIRRSLAKIFQVKEAMI
jgi:hypothetical protein